MKFSDFAPSEMILILHILSPFSNSVQELFEFIEILTLNKHKGYDHGYYFIHSFIEQHIEYHASNLENIKLI